jgi:hypothetical protein
MDIKDLIIFLLIFIAVMWLQNNDDKKFNKPERISLFDKIKLPLFIAVCILLIKNINYNVENNIENDENFLIFIKPTPAVSLPKNLPVNFNDIFTEQPDF